MTYDIPYLSLLAVAEGIRRRELTSEQVVTALLQRIRLHDGQLHSFLAVTADTALDQARQADQEIAKGLWRGPLHGVPIGIKDLIDIQGVPTTCGTEIFKDYWPPADATVTARLRQAGAVLIGKLHTTEAATLSHHPTLPRPSNPWGSEHWTGVSSSGSGVATAAGFCYGALGTDTGGSIRMPSAACGLTGIKPTWGRVSRHGLFPLAESFDHIGPMARSAADAAALLQVVAGADLKDPTALSAPLPQLSAELEAGIAGLVIGVDWELIHTNVDPLVIANVEQTIEVLQSLGVRIRAVTCPAFAAIVESVMPLMLAEIAVSHKATYPLQADRYGEDLKRMLDAAGAFSAADVVRALHARAAFRGGMREVFDEVDLLLTPASSAPTPTWQALDAIKEDLGRLFDRVGRFTMPFNVTGNPTISLPSGFDSGLPLGIQLIGPDLSEAMLCRAGHAFQRVTDFHLAHPSLSD